MTQLEKLHGLLEKGALTEEEFAEQKHALLQVKQDAPDTSRSPTHPPPRPSIGRPVVATLGFIVGFYMALQIMIGGLQGAGGGGGGDVLGLACVASPMLIVVGAYLEFMRRWWRAYSRPEPTTSPP